MASKVKKGFLYYLLWLVFIVVGVFAILASILLFNPGKDIYGIGIKYYNDSSVAKYDHIIVDGQERSMNNLGINKILFKSDYANFNVIKNNDFDKITFLFDKKINGFTKDREIVCSLDLTLDGNTLNVDVNAPNFWFPLSKSLNVTMYCPSNYSLSNYTFDLTTNTGAINLKGQQSTDGNIDYLLAKTEFSKLDIKTNSGSIYIDDSVKILSGEANIVSKESNIKIYSNITNKLNIDVENGKLYIDSMSGNLIINSTNMSVKCGTILGNVTYSSHSGYINIQKLGNSETSGNFSAEIDKLHIANVTIGEMTGNISVPNAKDSNITINKLGGIGLIETTTGNVKINKCENTIKINTNSGNVYLTQTNQAASTDIKTKSGTITANFHKIGTASIESEKATIKINVKTDEPFVFEYSSSKAPNISWIKETLEKSGKIFVAGATDSSPNKILSSSGSGRIYLNDGFELN